MESAESVDRKIKKFEKLAAKHKDHLVDGVIVGEWRGEQVNFKNVKTYLIDPVHNDPLGILPGRKYNVIGFLSQMESEEFEGDHVAVLVEDFSVDSSPRDVSCSMADCRETYIRSGVFKLYDGLPGLVRGINYTKKTVYEYKTHPNPEEIVSSAY